MTDKEKTAVAVKSFQEFEASLDAIREESFNAGYAAGVADRDAEWAAK